MLKFLAAAITAAFLTALPVHAGAQTAAPATTSKPTKAAKTEKSNKQPSAGQMAMRERQKKCGAEWKEAKAAGKVEKGQTWPKFWSACNKRLKGV